MNWDELKKKAQPFLEKATPYVERAKVYAGKAVDFTQKQLQNTPVVIKTVAEYEALLVNKRLILIGYSEKDQSITQEILLKGPIWTGMAWSDNAVTRYYTYEASPDLQSHLGASGSMDMRVYFAGTETFHTSDIETMRSWWKDRQYTSSDTTPATSPSETQNDKDPITSSSAV